MPVALSPEQVEADRAALLDAAERLFYARGIQLVGMDQIRSEAGLSLKRIYALYPAKEDLVVAVLRRRDECWRGRLAAHVADAGTPRERVLAVYDWLGEWFAEPDFRGCAWINVFGELGTSSPAVLAEVRAHKEAFRAQLADLARAARVGALTDALLLLAEGAMTTAAISGRPGAAAQAKQAASLLLDAARD